MFARHLLSSMNPYSIRAMTVDGVAPMYVLLEFARQHEITLTIPRGKAPIYGVTRPPDGCRTAFAARRAHSYWDAIAATTNKNHESLAAFEDPPSDEFLMSMGGSYVPVPFIMTSTRWYGVLDHLEKHSMHTVRELAHSIRNELTRNKPFNMDYDGWHLPYTGIEDINGTRDIVLSLYKKLNIVLTEQDFNDIFMSTLMRLSASRCARLDWAVIGASNTDQVESDIEQFNLLFVKDGIRTPDALCHQLTPDEIVGEGVTIGWRNAHLHMNYDGWVPFLQVFKENDIAASRPTAPVEVEVVGRSLENKQEQSAGTYLTS